MQLYKFISFLKKDQNNNIVFNVNDYLSER